MAVFDPTGRRVVYAQSEELGSSMLSLLPADGSQLAPTRLPSAPPGSDPGGWTADGRIIVSVSDGAGGSTADILSYSLRDSAVSEVVATPFMERYCALSPDEKWLAYESNRSGSLEIWVQSLSDGAPRRVSSDGGADPLWAGDGSELYYQRGATLMAVPVSARGEEIELGTPMELFRDLFIPAEDFTPRSYDVHPDGRFLMVADTEVDDISPNLVVIQNWAQEVDRRLTARASDERGLDASQ
jgi:Tol biopolymer transport system component